MTTADELTDAAPWLTERQAEAYVLRRIGGVSRPDAAEKMGTSASNVDNLERAARARLIGAKEVCELLDHDPREI
jgi:DNA-directed RNA polymerase specialized sigma24 family protein